MGPIYQTPFISASVFEDQQRTGMSGAAPPSPCDVPAHRDVPYTGMSPHPAAVPAHWDVPAPPGMSPQPEPPRWAPQAPPGPGLTLLCAPVWRMTLRSSTFPTGTRDMLWALPRARAGRGAAGAAGGV